MAPEQSISGPGRSPQPVIEHPSSQQPPFQGYPQRPSPVPGPAAPLPPRQQPSPIPAQQDTKRIIPTRPIDLIGRGSGVIQEIGGDDEMLLTSGADDAYERWLVGAIESLNGKKGVTTQDTLGLLLGVRLWLVVQIVEFSYGDTVRFVSPCPKKTCGHLNEKEVSLSRQVIPSRVDYPPEDEFCFATSTRKQIVYGFCNGFHEKALAAMENPSALYLQYMRVRKIDGIAVVPEIVKDTLNAQERMELRAELQRNPGGGINTAVTVLCSKCGTAYQTLLQEHLSFFLPGLQRG